MVKKRNQIMLLGTLFLILLVHAEGAVLGKRGIAEVGQNSASATGPGHIASAAENFYQVRKNFPSATLKILRSKIRQTRQTESVSVGNTAPVSVPVNVTGSAHLVPNGNVVGSGVDVTTTTAGGDPGVTSGNVVQTVYTAPVQATGNSIGLFGTLGDGAANGTAATVISTVGDVDEAASVPPINISGNAAETPAISPAQITGQTITIYNNAGEAYTVTVPVGTTIYSNGAATSTNTTIEDSNTTLAQIAAEAQWLVLNAGFKNATVNQLNGTTGNGSHSKQPNTKQEDTQRKPSVLDLLKPRKQEIRK